MLITVGDASETVDTLYSSYSLHEAGFGPVVLRHQAERREAPMAQNGAKTHVVYHVSLSTRRMMR